MAMKIIAPIIATIALIALLKSRERSVLKRFDPLLALRGTGRRIWANEHADEFVHHLRADWE